MDVDVIYVLHFNPRSYKRSDVLLTYDKAQNKISIHAPTRGATILLSQSSGNTQFQSTLLQEERQYRVYEEDLIKFISIHAPTRGATAKMHNIPYASLQ